ncbi:hypothetical protein HNQ62_002329 [Sulfurisphaera ohwakuensis]|uniref:Uncharacterized protein n=1 Tax=Sulfurisphaera ohwakuensis TaxID=69656 RepID=A0A7J9RUZ4_SULOH|nr:hypothetical protein [Sulfurisphaera ohwakuensis]
MQTILVQKKETILKSVDELTERSIDNTTVMERRNLD